MSSACSWSSAVLLALLASTACGPDSATPDAARVAPHRIDSPVGPLPGPPVEATASAENPFADDVRALQEGRRFFVSYNCAGCHGDHGGGGMGPSLRDERWLYGSTDADIADSIVEGRAHGMPAWGRMLTGAQGWQIAAYVKSMRTSHEPDPPGRTS